MFNVRCAVKVSVLFISDCTNTDAYKQNESEILLIKIISNSYSVFSNPWIYLIDDGFEYGCVKIRGLSIEVRIFDFNLVPSCN